MKTKIIIIAVLVLIVGAGFASTLLKKTNTTSIPVNKKTSSDISSSPTSDIKMESGVVAYYFHGNRRCKTCRAIEAHTNEALQENFADAIKSDRLVWLVINVDEPNNEHFIQDFQLSSSGVVLVRFENGEPKEWKNLNRVWQIVHGDKNIFFDYIQMETRAYLEGKMP